MSTNSRNTRSSTTRRLFIEFSKSIITLGCALAIPALVGRNRRRRRQSENDVDADVPKPKRTKRIPDPPTTIHIDNVNGVDCADDPVVCDASISNTFAECYQCRQYRYECLHLDSDLIHPTTNRIIPKNLNSSEGYCLPSKQDLQPPNDFTTQTLLAEIDGSLGFINLCRYPDIFSQTHYLNDCTIYRNPCGVHGTLGDITGRLYDDSTIPIWFDPFVDGVCYPHNSLAYRHVLSETHGPTLEAITMGSASNYDSIPSDISWKHYIRTDNYDDLIAAGFKPMVARRLTTMPLTVVPRPCMVDPFTGALGPTGVPGALAILNTNFFDVNYKTCVCFNFGGWVSIMEDQDLQGNYTDSDPNFPNACIQLLDPNNDPQPVEIFTGGYVNPDSDEVLFNYNPTSLHSYWLEKFGNITTSKPGMLVRDVTHPNYKGVRQLNRTTPYITMRGFGQQYIYQWPYYVYLSGSDWGMTNGILSKIQNTPAQAWWEINGERFRIQREEEHIMVVIDTVPADDTFHQAVRMNPVSARNSNFHSLKVYRVGVNAYQFLVPYREGFDGRKLFIPY